LGIRRKQRPAAAEEEERGHVRMTGSERLVDVASTLFGDDRLVPLLMDLNPALGAGALPANTVVALPTPDEIRRFASQMGLSLGFDPSKPSGTRVKNAWSKMKGEGQAAAAVDPHELMAVLAKQGLTPEVAARRLAKLVDEDALQAFLDDPGESEAARAVAAASRAVAARGRLRRVLKALSGMLTAAGRAGSRRTLLAAVASDTDAARAVLAALLLPEAVRNALIDAAAYAVPHLDKAEAIAAKDPVVRDAELDAIDDEGSRAIMRQLVMAAVDGVPLLGGERAAAVGVEGVLAAWEKHAAQVGNVLTQLAGSLDDTPAEVLIAVADGAGGDLPRPWPLAAAMVARLGDRVLRLHAGRQDLGVAALIADVVPGDGLAEAVLSAAELTARAAANARIADAHDAVPARLAETMVMLFDPLRPSSPDTGSEGQQKQRRRTRIEKALLVGRDEEVSNAASVAVVDELIALAKALDDETGEERKLKRQLRQLSPAQKAGCQELAAGLSGSVPALLRNASPVARGLLAMAVAVDRELGPTLQRGSGREAAQALLEAHATRAITLCIQRYVQGDARAEVRR
jgi:hypothetical protein